MRLVLTADDGLPAARAAMEAELAAFDTACSRFRADSDLSAVNRSAGAWIRVGGRLMDALEAALWAAEATDGAVDPTVGTALRVAGYDRDFAAVPQDAGPLTVRLRPVPGWQAVSLDRDRSAVRVDRGVELDLGATAKALAADRCAAAALRAAGAGGALVALGGDIGVCGDPPPGGWHVLVAEDCGVPLDADGDVVALLAGGIATSSTSIRRWTRGGTELHHIVDPATGAPVTGPWRSVTVAAATCVEANAAATAAIVLGESAVAWLIERGLPARLVGHDGEAVAVAGWAAGAPA